MLEVGKQKIPVRQHGQMQMKGASNELYQKSCRDSTEVLLSETGSSDPHRCADGTSRIKVVGIGYPVLQLCRNLLRGCAQMTIANLADALNTSSSEIRGEIHDMREKGWAIIADNNGIHKTHSALLALEQAEKLDRRAANIMAAANGMRTFAMKELTDKQQTILELLDWVDPEKKEEFDPLPEDMESIMQMHREGRL